MPICAQFLPVPPLLRTLASNCSFLTGFPSLGLLPRRKRSIHAYGWRDCRRRVFAAADGFSSNNGAPDNGIVKKRNIVEHIFLLKAKPDLTDVEEKDMLDYLYTCQYQTRGILAMSLGRIEEPNIDNFSHVVYMRFQKQEDLAKFYSNSYYSKVLEEHVTPFSYASISVDYVSEVEDDILPIFRRGEEFNYGVECLLLISILETASREAVEDALATLQNLIGQFKSFIVQATLGHNLNNVDSEYTHAAVIRFPSFEDFKLFKESKEYRDQPSHDMTDVEIEGSSNHKKSSSTTFCCRSCGHRVDVVRIHHSFLMLISDQAIMQLNLRSHLYMSVCQTTAIPMDCSQFLQ